MLGKWHKAQKSPNLAPSTGICRSRKDSREWSLGSVPLCFHAFLNISNVSIFFCPKPALPCLGLGSFEGKPSCLWSITCGHLSPGAFFPRTCINLRGYIDSKATSTPELSGITLHPSISLCIAGVSFPYVKEMLSTINIIIHVTGGEHTFRGASAACNVSCPPAMQNKRLCVNNINGYTQPVQMKSRLLLISLQGFHVPRLFVYSRGQLCQNLLRTGKLISPFFAHS